MGFQGPRKRLGRHVERQVAAAGGPHKEPEQHALMTPIEQAETLGVRGWVAQQLLVVAISLPSNTHALMYCTAAGRL